jgi:sterol desaturase/sphingolipid hydroxylase (fatty acid hydroxylase superfamily)
MSDLRERHKRHHIEHGGNYHVSAVYWDIIFGTTLKTDNTS